MAMFEKGVFSAGAWPLLGNLEDPELRRLAQSLPATVLRSRADSTTKKYLGALQRWKTWAEARQGVPNFPVHELHLVLYMQHLSEKLHLHLSEEPHLVLYMHHLSEELHLVLYMQHLSEEPHLVLCMQHLSEELHLHLSEEPHLVLYMQHLSEELHLVLYMQHLSESTGSKAAVEEGRNAGVNFSRGMAIGSLNQPRMVT
ncbi:hypothetical protein EMCRGX_G008846 [Ephydatia muelleri]